MKAPNSSDQSGWSLDPRLKADTLPLATVGNCSILLMNDRRWPWIIIVPQCVEAEELHDLPDAQRQEVLELTNKIGKALKITTQCEKINTAALGNIVRQLHVHIVARSTGDANWPAPVWGYGTAEHYKKKQAEFFISTLRSHLKV